MQTSTTALREQAPHSPDTRRSYDLGGTWKRIVRGVVYDEIQAPSSLPPSGTWIAERSLSAPRLGDGERAFLRFEGVAYYATVTLNGKELGHMDAYIPAEFEVTNVAKDGENRLQATISDLGDGASPKARDNIAIGVNPGWEAYGGIIRDVRLEVRPAAFVDNARLSYTLNADLSRADCRLEVFASSPTQQDCEVTVVVQRGNDAVSRTVVRRTIAPGNSTVDAPFVVDGPLLWSTDSPHLYQLAVTLRTNQTVDTYSFRTGFRQFAIRGARFQWNGRPLVLQGLCRHDMWLDQGFTLSRDQMRRDMQAIKAMGANFVRLVHYPHHRYIVELAEELGLLVTEEPGYWQVEFPSMPPSQVETGLRILEGAIRRDWNSPAVFGWFLGNESRLTVEYLREGRELCRRLDPLQRPVSFANDTRKEKAKEQFDAAGLDFYSQHLYNFDRAKFDKTAEYYGPGKPLIIDEWGWEDPGEGQIFWDRDFDYLLNAMRDGRIAGHSFWSWNDVRQYARIDWPTYDGTLFSGVVTENREPRTELYQRLATLFQNKAEHAADVPLDQVASQSGAPTVVPLRMPVVERSGPVEPISLQDTIDSPQGRAGWQALEHAMAGFWEKSRMAKNQWARTGSRLTFWRQDAIEIAGIRFVCPVSEGYVRPLIVAAGSPEVSVPIDRTCTRIYVLGNVTLPSGYPLHGKGGATAAVIEVVYGTGRSEAIPLRNGIEIARSNLVHDATRIDAFASAAPQALVFQRDPAREHYQALLFAVRAKGRVESLRIRHVEGPPVAMFAVATQAEPDQRSRS